MKLLIKIIALFFCGQMLAQYSFDAYQYFDDFAKPSTTSNLSNYFREHLNTDLLKAVKFRDTLEGNKRIILTFRLKNSLKPWNIRVNSQYGELNDEIMEVFKNYDVRQLNLPKENIELYIYKVQIISSLNDKAIINCNTNVVFDRAPVFKGCELKLTHSALSTCNYVKLDSFVASQINREILQNYGKMGEQRFVARFIIDTLANTEANCSKAPTVKLALELDRVLNLLPVKEPALRNGRPINFSEEANLALVIESLEPNKSYLKEFTVLYPDGSDIAMHFYNKIKDDEFENALKLPNVYLYFNINKRGKYINIRNSIQNKALNAQVNKIFSDLPIEKLHLEKVDPMVTYSFRLMQKLKDKKMYIFPFENKPQTKKSIAIEGCEEERNDYDVQKCNREKVLFYVRKHFDVSLRSKTKIQGNIMIKTNVFIETTGEVSGIVVKSANPFLSNEMDRVIRKMPYKISPMEVNGEPVKCSLEYSFTLRNIEHLPNNPKVLLY